jgi:two-component system, NarL family, sensor histidine kinase DesK
MMFERMDMRRESGWNGPWPSLVFLLYYLLPWLWRPPGLLQIAVSMAALAIFLPVYLFAYRVRGRPLILACTSILAIGVALAPLGGGWTVFPVYAAAAAARLRPHRLGLRFIAGLGVATVVTGLAWSQPVLWWAPGVILLVMVGGAGLSREAFYEQTRALVASQAEVRRLAGIAERERIERDLHDVVGRTLTLIALKADLALRLSDRDLPAAQGELRAVAEAARAGLSEVRAALAGQVGGGLAHEVSASLAALETAGIEAQLVGDPDALPPDAGAVLAMTLREAVTNVMRHASARRCRLEVSVDATGARLVVADDGVGGLLREGNGITGMRKRLVAAGGTLSLHAGGEGIRLVAAVPA